MMRVACDRIAAAMPRHSNGIANAKAGTHDFNGLSAKPARRALVEYSSSTCRARVGTGMHVHRARAKSLKNKDVENARRGNEQLRCQKRREIRNFVVRSDAKFATFLSEVTRNSGIFADLNQLRHLNIMRKSEKMACNIKESYKFLQGVFKEISKRVGARDSRRFATRRPLYDVLADVFF
jgi:hypothetical protein